MATRIAVYIPVSAIDTITTAMQFLMRWYPIMGMPAVFRSDRGSAFASDLMHQVRKLLGIKLWDSSAAGDAQHHSLLESKHKALDSTLDMAYNKGDILGPIDLEFYTAAAMARNNLDTLTDSATAFERLTGEIPRTLLDVASYAETKGDKTRTMKPVDLRFVNKIKDYIQSNMTWLWFVNSERVRKDVGHKLVASEGKRSTAFDFRTNDMVSYRGNAVKITELLHQSAHGYAKAKIRRTTHDHVTEDTVNYADLDPIGTSRPELMIDRQVHFDVGNLIFFESETGKLKSGTITKKIDLDFMVHLHQQANVKEKRFLPLYIRKGNDSTPKPREKVTKNDSPVIELVSQAKVLASTLLEKHYIPETALPGLRSRGVMMMPLLRTVIMMPVVNTLPMSQQIPFIAAVRTLAQQVQVTPFGPCETMLANIHRNLPLYDIDVDNPAEVWDPELVEIQSIISQITHTQGARPTRSAQASTKPKSHRQVKQATCARQNCPCTSTWSNAPGDFCCFKCRDGQACALNYHKTPSGNRPKRKAAPSNSCGCSRSQCEHRCYHGQRCDCREAEQFQFVRPDPHDTPPVQALLPQAAAPQHAGNTDEIHSFRLLPDELLEGYSNSIKVASDEATGPQQHSFSIQQQPPSGQALEIPDHEPPSYNDIIATVGLPAWQMANGFEQRAAGHTGPIRRARPARSTLSTTDADAIMAQMLADNLIQHANNQPLPQQTITLNLSDMLSSLTAQQIASNIIILSLMTYMTMVIVHYLFLYTMDN